MSLSHPARAPTRTDGSRAETPWIRVGAARTICVRRSRGVRARVRGPLHLHGGARGRLPGRVPPREARLLRVHHGPAAAALAGFAARGGARPAPVWVRRPARVVGTLVGAARLGLQARRRDAADDALRPLSRVALLAGGAAARAVVRAAAAARGARRLRAPRSDVGLRVARITRAHSAGRSSTRTTSRC